jgi:2'-5' RNA ligase
MEDMTAELGFPGESRPFRAHITLARMRRDSIISDELRDYILNNRDTLYGESSFGRIILFKSQLTKSGPLYTKLAEKLLGAAGR